MVKLIEMDDEDNAWMNIHRAQRLLRRELTDEERRDVVSNGFKAKCLQGVGLNSK